MHFFRANTPISHLIRYTWKEVGLLVEKIQQAVENIHRDSPDIDMFWAEQLWCRFPVGSDDCGDNWGTANSSSCSGNWVRFFIFVTWCIMLLEAFIRGWVYQGHNGIDVVCYYHILTELCELWPCFPVLVWQETPGVRFLLLFPIFY